jgi:flagellar hook-length control protein FliK
MSTVNTNNAVRNGASPGSVVMRAPAAIDVPTAPDRAPEHAVASPRPFAELLRQRQDQGDGVKTPSAAAPAPLPSTNETSAANDADDANGAPTSTTSPPNTAASKGKARAPASTSANGAPAKRADCTSAGATDAAHHDDRTAAPSADGSGSTTATGLQSAAALAAAAAAGVDPARATHLGAGTSAGTDSADATALADASKSAAAMRRVEASDTDRSDLLDSARELGSKAAAPTFLAALVEAGHAVSDPQLAREGRSDTVASALAVSSSAASEVARVDAPVAQVALATPFEAPDFSSALGVQVSLLARDGVQHAELHLNPAEMGPVSIHIALDGSAAHVDFGADLAATRDAIERGLPELAAALRDAGFTLAGGGVSQHASEDRTDGSDDTRPGRRRAGIDAAGPAAVATRITQRVAAGGLDLYA